MFAAQGRRYRVHEYTIVSSLVSKQTSVGPGNQPQIVSLLCLVAFELGLLSFWAAKYPHTGEKIRHNMSLWKGVDAM